MLQWLIILLYFILFCFLCFVLFCVSCFIFVVPQFMFYATNRLFILFYFIVFCFVYLFIYFIFVVPQFMFYATNRLFILFYFICQMLWLFPPQSTILLLIKTFIIFVLFNFQSSCYFVKFAKGIKILFNCVYLAGFELFYSNYYNVISNTKYY